MTGEDLELAAAAGAALDLDAEHALQALRPVHRHLSRRRLGWISCILIDHAGYTVSTGALVPARPCSRVAVQR